MWPILMAGTLASMLNPTCYLVGSFVLKVPLHIHTTFYKLAACRTNQMVETGAFKAAMPVWRQLLLGVLAGVCVSLGAFLALTISGNNPALSTSHPGLYRLLFGAFGCALLYLGYLLPHA